MKSDRFDLVVLGAGLAGLAAGNRALQLGRSVAVVEQGDGDSYPCNTRYSGGVLHLAFQNVKDSPESLRLAIEEATHHSSDPDVMRALATTGARAVDWLRAEGAKFIRVGQVVWQQWVLAPPRPLTPGLDWKGRGPDLTLRTLMQNFKRRGGRVFQNCTGSELVERDGICVGLNANIEGRQTTLEATAVLIADGGFQADLALLKQNVSPRPERLLQRGAANSRGAGLRMAQAMGAEITDLSTFYGHLLAREALVNSRLWPYPQLDDLATAGVVIGSAGERIADEGLGGVYLANMIARRADPLECFVVFDENIWETAGKMARIPANPNLLRAGAKLLSADSLDALAAAMNVPRGPLEQTIGAYNDALRTGRPGTLAPPRSNAKHVPIAVEQRPFHALPICVGITHTTGGIAIDERARVRRKGGGFVPGLYAQPARRPEASKEARLPATWAG